MLADKTEDAFYRYTVPSIKFENIRGNWTKVTNFKAISSAINIDILYIDHFFVVELACTPKKDKDGGMAFNGNFSATRLKEVLDKFIEMYCKCPMCKLPEIIHAIRKGQLCYKCKACGKTGSIVLGHKMTQYFIKNGKKTKINVNKSMVSEE